MPSPHPPGATDVRRPSAGSRRGLDAFAFFVANLQAGFGPFVSVYLTTEKWTQVDIGLVLTVGGVAGLLLQAPSGALVDATRHKRRLAAWSVSLVGLSALAMAANSAFAVILAAWVLHAAASATLTPCIAAVSLGLAGHGGIARRFGRNASFGSLGNSVAAALMGGIGYWVSNQAVFLVTAALMVPALLALRQIRPEEIGPTAAPEPAGPTDPAAPARWSAVLANRTLLVLFACVLLFYLANAAMLPLVGSALTLRSRESPSLLIAACIIVPQVLVTVLSPFVGHYADRWGRKALLLIAFAVLPAKGLWFGFVADPSGFVVAQTLDGVSGAILGVLVSLVVADATRAGGHFALAQGLIGTAMGIGASVSTLLAGYMADRYGSSSAFIGLAAVGLLAFLVLAVALPETGKAGPVRPDPGSASNRDAAGENPTLPSQLQQR